MDFLSETAAYVIMVFIICSACVIYANITSNQTYWKDRKIPYVESNFLFGMLNELFPKTPIALSYQKVYTLFRSEKLVGLYELNNPYLLIRDIDIAKAIMTKDFQNFMNRGFFESDLVSTVGKNLFLLEGEEWKNMRSKVTPAFTSVKIKNMFNLMKTCSDDLITLLNLTSEKGDGCVDIGDVIAKYTTDVTACCGFGLESNCVRDPDCEFNRNRKILCQPFPTLKSIKHILAANFPRLCRMMGLKLLEKETDQFFMNIVSETMRYRESRGIVRNDFVDHLIRLKHDRSCGKHKGGASQYIKNIEEGIYNL